MNIQEYSALLPFAFGVGLGVALALAFGIGLCLRLRGFAFALAAGLDGILAFPCRTPKHLSQGGGIRPERILRYTKRIARDPEPKTLGKGGGAPLGAIP